MVSVYLIFSDLSSPYIAKVLGAFYAVFTMWGGSDKLSGEFFLYLVITPALKRAGALVVSMIWGYVTSSFP